MEDTNSKIASISDVSGNAVSSMKITHLGTAMVLIEVGSLRIVTDPVLDPSGGYYEFGFGTNSTKITEPLVTKESLGEIDAVLLSHDQHADNLDKGGREFLPFAGKVLTTPSGSRRLSSSPTNLKNVVGMKN